MRIKKPVKLKKKLLVRELAMLMPFIHHSFFNLYFSLITSNNIIAFKILENNSLVLTNTGKCTFLREFHYEK